MSTYHIHREPSRLPLLLRWWDFPYDVCEDPCGDGDKPCRFVGNTSTLWGARRMVRREQSKPKRPPYWETPIVEGAEP